MLSFSSVFSLIIQHWEWIVGLIAFIFPSTGIGVYLNRRSKASAEVKENELIANAPPEKAKIIKESKIKKQKQDLIIFIINAVLMLILLAFINKLFNDNITRGINLKDLEWVKQLVFFQICSNIAVLAVFASRVASSITSFDTLMSSLPIIKQFVKK